jgi:Domain of unknown function (DUF4394)
MQAKGTRLASAVRRRLTRRVLGGFALGLRNVVLGALAAAALAGAASAGAPTLVALVEPATLVVFSADRPEVVTRVSVRGLGGTLVGIDRRPADGRLYGLTTASEIYTVDATSGEAKLVSSMTVPFEGGAKSGIDFNPQADRLRLVSSGGQNLRVNVDLGATAVDPPVAYAPTDVNAGKRPAIAASAYTNSRPGAATTKLFNIDSAEDVLVLQDPPNDGVLTTVGRLGVDFAPAAGFEIVTEPTGEDRAYAVSGGTLYAIDLSTGAATRLGTIGAGDVIAVALTSTGTP